MKNYQLFIDGKWTDSVSEERFEIINPATEEVVASTSYGDERDAKLAIDAAQKAFSTWSKMPVKERSVILLKIYNLMMERQELLASTISREMGKPIKEARGEVKTAAEFLAWNAEEARRTYGETIPAPTKDKRLITVHQPIGVVAAITPWNFPLTMVTRKIAPALAVGCPVVFKPASQTIGSAVQFFKIAEEAGMPPGAINLVMGKSREISAEFLSNPAVKKITFTGSTEVGKQLLRGAADQVKKVSMELGGHAPFIVFEDADIEAAVEGAIISKFRNAGQTCICANRIYVQSSVLNKFISIVKEKVNQMVIGEGLNEETDIGPVINAEAIEKVEEHVLDAVTKGAQLVTGGKKWKAKKGFFYEPTVLANANDEMKITTEETFGPVAPIYSFESEEEVLQRANNTIYGLAAYYYTKDLARSYRVYEGLEYGIIGCNDPIPSVVEGPFGGFKQSGMGKEGGPQGIYEFLETKFVSFKI